MNIADVADELAAALVAEGVAGAVTISRTTVSGGSPADPTSGAATTASYSGLGWVDKWTQDEAARSAILAETTKIIVLAATLATVPTTTDRVTVGGQTYAVTDVSADAATAAYVLAGRA